MNKLTIILLAIAIVLPTSIVSASTGPASSGSSVTVADYISNPEKYVSFKYNSSDKYKSADKYITDECADGIINSKICYILVSLGYFEKARIAAVRGEYGKSVNAASMSYKTARLTKSHVTYVQSDLAWALHKTYFGVLNNQWEKRPAYDALDDIVDPQNDKYTKFSGISNIYYDGKNNTYRGEGFVATIELQKVSEDKELCSVYKALDKSVAQASGIIIKVYQDNIRTLHQNKQITNAQRNEYFKFLEDRRVKIKASLKKSRETYKQTCEDVIITTKQHNDAYKKQCEAAGGKIGDSGGCFRAPGGTTAPIDGVTTPAGTKSITTPIFSPGSPQDNARGQIVSATRLVAEDVERVRLLEKNAQGSGVIDAARAKATSSITRAQKVANGYAKSGILSKSEIQNTIDTAMYQNPTKVTVPTARPPTPTPTPTPTPPRPIAAPVPSPTTATGGGTPWSNLNLPKLDPSLLKGIASGLSNMFKSGSGGKSSGGSKSTKPSTPKKKAPPQPKCLTFTTENQRIKPGETATLQYAMAFSEYSAISPGVGQVHPLGGTVKVSPSESTDYILRAQSRYGTVVCPSVHITVLPSDDTGEQSDEQPIVSCTPSRVAKGAAGLVLWQCPDGSTKSVGVSTEYPKFDTANKTSGSVRVRPTVTSKFVIRCRDDAGREIGRNSCTIKVGEAAGGTTVTPTASVYSKLVVNKANVRGGDTVTIAWQGYGTTNCTITGPDDFKEHGNKGSVTGRMLQTSTFNLSCTAGQATLPVESVTINVN